MRIDIEVVSSGSNDAIQKGCWMNCPPDETPAALTIACNAVQWARRGEGVAVIIRRAA